MKRLLLIPLAVALISIAASYSSTKDHPIGYHFFHAIHLDDQAIMTEKNMVDQPLMLAKDHDYDLVLKNTTSDVLITIKDDRGVQVATNFDEKTNTYYNSLVFQSHISEFYHVLITSEKTQDKGICRIYSKPHLDEENRRKQ